MKFTLGFLISVFSFTNSYALNTDELLHPAAHAGGAYALTHASEVICKKVSHLSKFSCTIIGASVAASASVLVELSQGEENTKNHLKSYAYDGLGIGAAVTFISLDF